MISEADILNASILIVDDKQANVLLLAEMLRDVGYTQITSTNDPYQVSTLHQLNHYDLILLDLQMPGMDGFAVMDCLRKVDADDYHPVLVITAQPNLKLRALAAGAKDFVSKPFDRVEVLMRVHNMLEVRLLHEAARNHSKILESLALTDPLTGLANRRLLADRMSMALVHARRNKSAMAVVYLDLDGFKQVNDTLGHGSGDLLLKMVAARLGGDEFMIVLWHISGSDDVIKVALKIFEALSQPYDIEGHSVSITTSIGISLYPVHGEDADTLMKRADLALYDAKRTGKNTYRISARTDLSVVASNSSAISTHLW